jgi:hypothetical protein
MTADQKIQLMNKRGKPILLPLGTESIKDEAYPPSADYTQTVRSKFVLIFAIFAISAK